MVARTSLTLLDGELLVDTTEYRSMVSALKYLTMTWPDIVCVVNVASKFMREPLY